MSIWQQLPKPFFALAPMEDVTDTVFRRIVASCAPADVYFTEFTNADGLASVGRGVVGQRLKYTEEERPIIGQLWGKNPEHFYAAAKHMASQKFDGVDINFGCPVKAVVMNGCCSGLIGREQPVTEIIRAVQQGIADSGNPIAVSVKTRIGYKQIVTDTWIPFLLSLGIDALTIHGRTASEMSAVPAHWDEIGKAVDIRNTLKSKTVIIGNGDVKDRADGLVKVKEHGVDGVMIGRGIFENLWAFDKAGRAQPATVQELLPIMRRHVELYDKTWGEEKNYATLRKFFKIYVKGFEGAGEWREKVMTTRSPEEVYPLISEMIKMLE